MNKRPSELDTLIQAARKIESQAEQERTQFAKQAQELKQMKKYAQDLRARDGDLRRYIESIQTQFKTKLQAAQDQNALMQRHNIRILAELKEKERTSAQDLANNRSTLQQAQNRIRELEAYIHQMQPELARARGTAERAQADSLERERQYQSSLASYQARDRDLHEVSENLKNHLRRAQSEITQLKSQLAESERLRHEAERQRGIADQNARRHAPDLNRMAELEHANRGFEQRLMIERRQRQHADAALEAERQEKEMLSSKLRLAQDRLERTEAELSKAASEAALLKAARKAGTRKSSLDSRDAYGHTLEAIEKFALPSFPTQD